MKFKIIITILIVVITSINLFAEVPFVSKMFSSNQTKNDQDLKNHITQYYQKYKDLGLKSGESYFKFENQAYYYKINLNEADNFKNLTIDLQTLSKNDFVAETIGELALISQVVIVGTVTNRVSLDDLALTEYNIKVESLLKGAYLYNNVIPQNIKIYSEVGTFKVENMKFTVCPSEIDKGLEINTKFIFFLSKINWDIEPVSKKIINNPFAFPMPTYARVIDGNGNLKNVPQKTSIKVIKELIEQIVKLNDEENFFNREHK